MAVSLIVGKLLTTIFIVLGLSWVAERVDTRIAGLLSGMPLGALLVLTFVGHDLGPEFAAESALYAIPSVAGTLTFASLYYLLSKRDYPLSLVITAIGSLLGYFCVVFPLSHFSFNLLSALGLGIASIVIAGHILKGISDTQISAHVHLTIRHLVFRAGTAAFFVIVITGIAEAVGPRWSGLLIGFPITFLPLLLIIQLTYSKHQAHTVIRNFPLGLGGLLTYLTIATQVLPSFGTNFGILISLFGSLVYLALIGYIFSRRNLRRSERAGNAGEP